MSTDPKINSLLVSISNFLKLVAVFLGAHGYGQSGIVANLELGSAAVLFLGPAAWDVWSLIASIRKSKAQGVQAGINLVVAGKAVDSDGAPVSKIDPDATPPKPVTLASAAEIVKDFAPPASAIQKS